MAINYVSKSGLEFFAKKLLLNDKKIKDEVLKPDAIVADLTTTSGSTTLSTAGLQTELDKKLDKTSILTAKDNSATDDQVYSAKAINTELGEYAKTADLPTPRTDEEILAIGKYQIKNYNTDLKVNNTIEKLEDLLKLVPSGQTWYIPDFNIDQAVTDYGFPEGARPWGTMIITNSISAGHYIIELQSNTNYQFENRWVGETKNGVAGSNQPYQVKWQRLCTTSVADVPETKLTLNSWVTGNIFYTVKNGICFVRVDGLTSATMSTHSQIIVSGLPKPMYNGVWHNIAANSGSYGSMLVKVNDETLINYIGSDNVPYYGSFSYPVSES